MWQNTDELIHTIYFVILGYFLLGAVGFYFINRRRSKPEAKASYVKFLTYFIIINLIYWWVVWWSSFFPVLVIVIGLTGLGELVFLFLRSGYRHPLFFLVAVICFAFLFSGFYNYSRLTYTVILYVFLIVSIFDSFSQISGQLWGKRKILPSISPNKTLGGILGGAVIALASGFLMKSLYQDLTISSRIFFLGMTIFSAFLGDVISSIYKRKYGVKDFNQLIPGHGGFLDRFDSLIAAGAWTGFYMYLSS